jgi:hypothetical protein
MMSDEDEVRFSVAQTQAAEESYSLAVSAVKLEEK